MENAERKTDRQERIPDFSQKTIHETRIGVIGAGATGNEVLKNLALVGVGYVYCTDMDHIASSNISRTVLFTGRHQIDALFCGEYSLGGVYRLLVHGFCKDVRDRVFHIIRGLEPKRHCEVRLRIEIDRQYRISLPHKSGTEVHGGGGLSDTTFLVRYRDYFGHGVPPY